MERFATGIVRLIWAAQKAWTKKWIFGVLAVAVFVVNVGVLGNLDLLPNPVAAQPTVSLAATVATESTPSHVQQASTTTPELPVKIAIPAISLTASILNPDTTNVERLDQALLSGAVRYPTSAKLGQVGNVVLFGHSSYLPIVGNQAYKTFDGIQKLKSGDAITVYSSGTAYTYAVRSVTKADANSDGVPLAVSGKELTLATCDSFSTKNTRFIVVADFVESHLISS